MEGATQEVNLYRGFAGGDSQACGLKRKDAMDCSRWRKQIGDDWPGQVQVSEYFFCYRLTRVVQTKDHKMVVVVVVVEERLRPTE